MADPTPDHTPTLPPAKPRVLWVDYAKGLSIFFVVVYHVWNGIMTRSAHIPSPEQIYDPINRAFEMMRMPLFFFVSGLFIGRSVQKPAGQFVTDKLGAVVWPYLIWSCVHIGLTILLARLTGDTPETTLRDLPYALAFSPVAQFWFLYVLFLAMMMYLVLVKLRFATWAILLVGVGLLLVKLNIDLRPMSIAIDRHHVGLAYWGPLFQLMNFFIYMTLGAMLAPVLLKRLDSVPARWLSTIAIGATAILTLAILLIDREWVMRDASAVLLGIRWPVGIGYALLSVAGALAIATLMSRTNAFGWVRFMGQYSLYIFVMHVLLAAGMRTILLKMGVDDFVIHMVAGLSVGIIVPVLIGKLCRRFGTTWAFTLRPG
jgi:uncharacterized membrane protein YcfT